MPKKPNILFFFTDQERADACGCYGQELPITPNLDALAEEGTRFEWAFTPQPVCGPCRRAVPDRQIPHGNRMLQKRRHAAAQCQNPRELPRGSGL